MIEKYIERNILREVYLCEQLFEFQEISITKTAKLLGVTTPTLLKDLAKLVNSLEYCIEEHKRERFVYKIIFKKGIALSELTQFLYAQSYFFKFLNYYFQGNFTSVEIANLEYISLSKVYMSKKILLVFFKENNYLKYKEVVIPEFDTRNILLALVRYINWEGYERKEPEIIQASLQLIDHVETHFFKRRYSDDEKFLIIRGIEIALGRKDIPLHFSSTDKKAAESKSLFQLVRQGLKKQNEVFDLQKDDVYYIFYLFNSRNYTNKNMDLLKKDIEAVYKNFVFNNPLLNELMSRLIKKTGINVTNDFLFKKSFLQFVRTFWADGQLFLPEKIYLLTEEEEQFYEHILKVLNRWKKKNQLKIRWNHNLVRMFVKNLLLSTRQVTKKQHQEFFIVAENSIKQLFYRSQFIDCLGENTIEINSGIFRSLDELPDEHSSPNMRVVLCDIAAYQPKFETPKTVIYPISLKKTRNQLQQIAQELNLIKQSNQ